MPMIRLFPTCSLGKFIHHVFLKIKMFDPSHMSGSGTANFLLFHRCYLVV
jgi:hypothetical protein